MGTVDYPVRDKSSLELNDRLGHIEDLIECSYEKLWNENQYLKKLILQQLSQLNTSLETITRITRRTEHQFLLTFRNQNIAPLPPHLTVKRKSPAEKEPPEKKIHE